MTATASMFRDFSFAAATTHTHHPDRCMTISPTTQTPSRYEPPSTPPPCTMGDLAAQLNQQSLRIDPTYSMRAASPPSEEQQNPRTPYSRVAASLLRMQRQSNARMQCSTSHVRDISALVRMIEDEEQCSVSETKSRTSSSSSIESGSSTSTAPDSDEALDMEDEPMAREMEARLRLRRWEEGERESCVRVTKTVRMRKRSGVVKRRRS